MHETYRVLSSEVGLWTASQLRVGLTTESASVKPPSAAVPVKRLLVILFVNIISPPNKNHLKRDRRPPPNVVVFSNWPSFLSKDCFENSCRNIHDEKNFPDGLGRWSLNIHELHIKASQALGMFVTRLLWCHPSPLMSPASSDVTRLVWCHPSRLMSPVSSDVTRLVWCHPPRLMSPASVWNLGFRREIAFPRQQMEPKMVLQGGAREEPFLVLQRTFKTRVL